MSGDEEAPVPRGRSILVVRSPSAVRCPITAACPPGGTTGTTILLKFGPVFLKQKKIRGHLQERASHQPAMPGWLVIITTDWRQVVTSSLAISTPGCALLVAAAATRQRAANSDSQEWLLHTCGRAY